MADWIEGLRNTARRALRREHDVLKLILIANLVAFAASMLVTLGLPETGAPASRWGPSFQALVVCGGLTPGDVVSGELHRLFVCVFLHGDVLHLGFNTWALFALGRFAQQVLGPRRFLTLYLSTGLLASAVSVGWKIASAGDLPLDRLAPSVGASGAVFGVFGYLLGLVRRAQDPASASIRSQLLMWLVINVVIGLSNPRIDNAAHFGGLAGGFLFAIALDARGLRPLARALSSRVAAALLALLAVLSLAVATAGWFGSYGRDFRGYLAAGPLLEDSIAITDKDGERRLGGGSWRAERELGALIDEARDLEGDPDAAEAARVLRRWFEARQEGLRRLRDAQTGDGPATADGDPGVRMWQAEEARIALAERMLDVLGPAAPPFAIVLSR